MIASHAGQGSLSVAPARRAQLITAAAAVWVLLLVTLVIWWGTVVLRQAGRIAELEALSGAAEAQFSRTRLMLMGESSVFIALLLALSALLAWLYWRESRRAHSMQAFFASVTHELRTPLTSIRLQAEAIAEGDQRLELARRLLEDTHRLESQIDKTLELARIEGGGPLSEQAVPLASWLPRTLESIGSAYGHGRLKWQLDFPAALPAVQADAAAVQMILRNLVENSLRHGAAPSAELRVAVRAQDGNVWLDFSDSGPGLPAGEPAPGELFRRGARSSGTGVGLYLVRRLMQRMGGEARFDAPGTAGFPVHLRFRASTGDS